jgi:predicted nucleotidyltransferase
LRYTAIAAQPEAGNDHQGISGVMETGSPSPPDATGSTITTRTLTNDPVLVRFRNALDEMYGSRLEHVVLFGSRARGDVHAGSDYDVAVFLRDMDDRAAELYRLADLSTDIIDETGEFVHAMPYYAGTYNERTPVMLGVRTDGVDL